MCGSVLTGLLARCMSERRVMIERYAAPGNWVFEPTAAQIRRTKKKNPNFLNLVEYVDATGRKTFLIVERAGSCHNAEIGEGKNPKSKKRSGMTPGG